MRTSENIDAIGPALLKAQINMGPVRKGKVNPHFKNKYADLASVIDAIKEPLNDEGIWLAHPLVSLSQEVSEIGCEVYILHAPSGQWMSSEFAVPSPKNDAQGSGSAGTYAQRYSLCAFFSLPQEDDDGNRAASVVKPVPRAVTDEEIAKVITIRTKVGEDIGDVKEKIKDYDQYVAEAKRLVAKSAEIDKAKAVEQK